MIFRKEISSVDLVKHQFVKKMNLYRAVLPMLAHDKESLCMFTINVFVGEARTVL